MQLGDMNSEGYELRFSKAMNLIRPRGPLRGPPQKIFNGASFAPLSTPVGIKMSGNHFIWMIIIEPHRY